ncbi:MAG: hypothetical protein ACP5OZ_01505 [Candidatus Woesearchaeota archaeon]
MRVSGLGGVIKDTINVSSEMQIRKDKIYSEQSEELMREIQRMGELEDKINQLREKKGKDI